MIYRAVILSAVLLSATVSYAAGQKAWSFKGTCSGNISQSDGVPTGAAGGTMSTKDYLALMKRARESHLTLGADGFLWAVRPLGCDAAIVMQVEDRKGHTVVSFSNGDPANPILSFAGDLIDGEGPLFFPDTAYFGSGEASHFTPTGSGEGCQFYFADRGGFSDGWQRRLTAIECEARIKAPDGHLTTASVTFSVAPSAPPQ